MRASLDSLRSVRRRFPTNAATGHIRTLLTNFCHPAGEQALSVVSPAWKLSSGRAVSPLTARPTSPFSCRVRGTRSNRLFFTGLQNSCETAAGKCRQFAGPTMMNLGMTPTGSRLVQFSRRSPSFRTPTIDSSWPSRLARSLFLGRKRLKCQLFGSHRSSRMTSFGGHLLKQVSRICSSVDPKTSFGQPLRCQKPHRRSLTFWTPITRWKSRRTGVPPWPRTFRCSRPLSDS